MVLREKCTLDKSTKYKQAAFKKCFSVVKVFAIYCKNFGFENAIQMFIRIAAAGRAGRLKTQTNII